MATLLPIASPMQMPGAASIDTSAATTYADLNGLAALKRDPNSPAAISAAAQQVEALFLQMMLKSMRDASAEEETTSNEMGMYQDMFDKQVALSISQHADLGISALLKRQLGGASKPPASTLLSGRPTASVGATDAALPSPTPAEFVHRVLPSIQRAARELGVDPIGMLAQAALETGWGQRMPRNADGSPSHNLFGIKAGDGWSGGRAPADTVEVSNGIATAQRVSFRSYGSIEQSVSDFASLLKNSPRYRDVIAAGADIDAFVTRLGQSGYATDPEYANKLNEILHSGTLHSALSVRTAAL